MRFSKNIAFCFAVLLPIALVVYQLGHWDEFKFKQFSANMPNILRLLTSVLAGTSPRLVPRAANDLIVDLGYAKYHGVTLENGITQWVGMRFAAPPLGNLRFRAPADPLSEEGVIDAYTVSVHLYTTLKT